MLRAGTVHAMKLLLRSTSHPSRPVVVQSLALTWVLHRSYFASGFSLPLGALQHCHQDSSSTYCSTSTSMYASASSKGGPPFPTWSFDKHCPSMEWNDLSKAELTIKDYTVDALDDADLVLIGVMAPAKAEVDDETSDDEDKEPEPMELEGAAQEIDNKLGGALSDLLREQAKTFKNGATRGSTTSTVRVATDKKATRYALLGLGAPPKTTPDNDDTGNTAAATEDPNLAAGFGLGKAIAAKCVAEKKIKSCAVVLPATLAGNTTVVTDLSTGLYQNLYADNRYRTGARVQIPAEDLSFVTILAADGNGNVDAAAAGNAIDHGRKLATGVMMTKDIVNAPHNVLNSESLADTARRIAEQSNGRIKCKILDKKECERRGMGAYLGVARGSETQPQFIHLTYSPPSGTVHKKVGCIGKGLTFDTGGYNIKTQMMEKMKFDCGGSAAVLGAARAVGALGLEGVEAHFIVAACENMINDRAMVPSDILTASNGKTIEVMNTDAEGRLTLADAFVYADKEIGCDAIIELSTLTGACMVALGQEVCGFWTSNDDLGRELEECSKVTGDTAWRMPLHKAYNEQLKSQFADLKNVGTRFGGAITAALFLLCNFVDPKKPAAHIDIAGPVWNDKTGATGFGAKMVVEWIRRQGDKSE